MGYDYETYWNKAFSNQSKEGFIPEIIEHLKGLEFKTVLELGSGQGHLSKELKNNFDVHLTGIDIIGPNYYLDEYWQRDISNLLFNKDFDLIIGRFVLMHIKPEHIDHLIKEINEHGKNILFVDYNPLVSIPLMPHNFKHNYPWKQIRLNDKNVMLVTD